MSSYWWPLGRSAAAAATTNQSPTPSAARSGATAATNTTRDGSSSAAQRPPSSSVDLRHLAQTAFHTSLDNLLVEATKHRSLVVLRDAVLETRQRRYDPVSLFDTLCIACSLLAERSGSSGARSFSNASSVAQAAAGEALEGARKALLSSSSNSNTGAPSTANTNINSSGGGAAGGGQGHTSASAGAAALESSFKASSSLSALAPMRATPPLGGATGGGTTAAAASSTATHSLHYRHRGAARGLLLQSISDVGKLIALGLLPVSLSVGQRVADLVREISFVAAAGAASHRQRQQSPPHASAGTAHTAAAAQERRGAESADGGLHGRAAASRTPPPPLTGPVELVHDDPVLVRLLQLTASAASACQLGSPALPELYGVLLLFYSGVEANSMLEATCEATLTHHIHTVLAALCDNGTSNDGASAAGVPASAAAAASSPLHSDSPAPPTGPSAAPFAAQLQGIAFMKDICRLMVGARTKWLHLSANRSSHRSSSSSGGRGAGGVGGQTANAATALHREKSTEAAAVTARRANSASSSMAAVTASVVAAAADAERLQQQQQQLNHDRSSQVNSLTSTPMTTAIPAANRDTSFSSFGSPLIAASAAGEGGGRRSPPSASLLLAATATAAAPSSGPATAMACVPERLRVFLMRAVTLFFKEQTTASPPASTTPVPAAARAAQPTASISARSGTDASALNASPLFVQCLNDCLFSVALWGMYEMDITVPMQPPPSLFVEVMQQQQYTPSHPSLVASSLELFACTQQLALVTISTNLSLTSNAAQVLMEAHERLLQRLYRKQKMRGAVSSPMHDKGGSSGGGGREADAYGERLSQAAIVVLTLWRKTLTSTTLLWDLLQLRATRDGSAPPSAFDAAGTAMGGSLADGIGHAMAAAESSSFLRIDNSRSTSEDSGTREYADTDSDSGAANAAAELDHRVAHDDENETDALSELESNNNNDRSNTGAVLVNTGDEKRPPVPVPPAHLRRRLQPLTLARSQALGAIGSHRLDTGSSREGLHDVGSPRLGMPPLARLVVAVVTLVMAYMQTPPHTPGLPSPAAGVHSSEPLPSGAAAASLPSVTPAPYDAQELSAGSSSLFVNDALAAATTASASDTAHLSSPRRKRSRHVPAMPRCLCATPPTVYQGLTEAVSFVAVFGQHFGQLVETQRRSAQDGNDGNTNSAHVLRRCSSCFVDLHPYLIRCGALCLRYLRYEEDVLPMVLKAVSCWVQVCCAVQLTQQRDAHLSLLLSALRMPDPVVGHLIALAPPTSLMAGTASASAGTAKTAMAALESLVVLNHHYASREPRVPGSVAAAALASDQMGDSSAQSRHHDPSYLAAGRNSSGSRSSMGMAGWGIGWLRRRGRTATAREQAESLTRTRTPHGGASSGTAGGQSGSSTTRARAAAEASRGATPDARSSTVGASQLGHQPTQQQQQQQSAPMLLISRGWRSPAVQHAVVLGVCRLQHRIMIMKTVHVLANALGAALEDGWALLAHSMALTEPLLHSLKRLLTWIEESSVEQEQQEQLLSDALHLRDALRSLCVNNTCRLPYDQLNCFFSGLVKGTAALGAPPAERSRAAGIAMTGHSWSAGFEGGEATLVAGESVGFNGDDLFHLSTQSSPSMAAYAHLPRHDPQGCADQWVLTSECLCLSMLAVLPFTEQRTAAEMSPVSSGAAGDRGGSSSSTTQAVTLQLLQRQRYGALMRALRLWQLETEVCRIALHPRHMERWGTSALISAQAHKRVLLSCTAAARQALRSTGGSGLLSESPSPEHGEAKPKAPASSASSPSPSSAAAKTKPSGAATASLTEEDVRALEATLTAVVGHVAAVAVHLCRSAARRRRGAEAGGAVAASGAAAAPYQARQSAALVIAAGPFAAVPLVQAANAIFASPAATVAPSPANLDPSLLPFVQADAALSTAALLYSLQRAVQASSSSASASSSALSGHTLHRTDGVAGSETLAGDAGQSSAAAAATASSAGAGGAVLDPLEHLLASPFALLDDVYAQWSQPVQRVHQAGSAVNDGRVAEGNGTPKHNEGEAEEEEGDVSPLSTHAATSRPSHATAAQQHVESDDDDERNDVAPAAAAGMCCGASSSEVAAAAAAVAAALPHVLASASTAVLMGVVKVVQANGEDIDGAAWESILSLLQRIATQTQAGAGVMSRQEGLLAGAGATTTTSTTSAAGAVMEAARTSSGASNSTSTNAGGGAQTVESLNTAFRALESIQHNHIPRLKVEGLHRLIVCVGAFTVHRVDGGVPGERKLHINLSAVQLLWSTADYLAAFGNASAGGLAGQDRQEGHGSGGVVNSGAYASQGGGEGSLYSNAAEFSSAVTRPSATAAQQHQQQQDRLWCSLLWQLRTGCLDDRQEIRQSAMQTFFALVQTYGWRFSGVCWRCVLHGVLQPLIEVVATATRLCATLTPEQEQQQQKSGAAATAGDEAASMVALVDASTSASFIPSLTAAAAAGSSSSSPYSSPAVLRLLREFMNQPAQLEEARVTLFDAGSRLFVTHHANMQAALQQPVASPLFGAAAFADGSAAGAMGAARPGSPSPGSSAAAVSPVFRRSPRSFPHGPGGNGGGTGASGGGLDEATAVLEALLQLCGDVCVVVKGTSGEQSAVAAVHALHGLLVEMPGAGLHPHGVHLAWRAMERLLLRGDAVAAAAGGDARAASPSHSAELPYAHTEAKQCTLTVVAAIVAAVCDSFRLQRMVAAAAAAANASPAMTPAQQPAYTATGGGALGDAQQPLSPGSSISGGFSAYFTGWGSGSSHTSGGTAAAAAAHGTPNKSLPGGSRALANSPDGQYGSPAHYFTRLLFLLQAVTRCTAVVNSYYFPSKPQTTLLEGVAAVWPTLTSREARMLWGEVLLPAFPSADELQRFVLQDVVTTTTTTTTENSGHTNSSAAAATSPLVALRAVMPPGSHPGYLSAVMDTMRSLLLLHMGIEGGATTTKSPRAGAANNSSSVLSGGGSDDGLAAFPPHSSAEDRTRLLFMAPSTVQVTGALMLLHLASPAVLAGPPRSGGVPFTVPALFLQECADLLQFALWGPVLSRAPATAAADAEQAALSGTHSPRDKEVGRDGEEGGGSRGALGSQRELWPFATSTATASRDASLPAAAAAARCRRDGVATLCRIFEHLLSAASAVVRHLDTQSRPSNANSVTPGTSPQLTPKPAPATAHLPPSPVSSSMAASSSIVTTTTVPQYVTTALQALDRLVDTLGEVVHLVMEQYEDVASATEAINALSVASTAEGMALARVAKRSLALLQRWADTIGSSNTSSGSGGGSGGDGSSSQHRGGVTSPTSAVGPHRSSVDSGRPAHSAEPRASRTQLQDVVRASMESRNRAILRQYIDGPDDASAGALLLDTLHDMLRTAQQEQGSGGGAADPLETWDALMPELLEVVACCSPALTRSSTAVAREKDVRGTLSALLSLLHQRHRYRYLQQQQQQQNHQKPQGDSLGARGTRFLSSVSHRKASASAEDEEAMSII